MDSGSTAIRWSSDAQESLIVSGNNPEPISVPHINISGVDAFENGNFSYLNYDYIYEN